MADGQFKRMLSVERRVKADGLFCRIAASMFSGVDESLPRDKLRVECLPFSPVREETNSRNLRIMASTLDARASHDA